MGDLVSLTEFTPAALVTAIRAAGYDVELFESASPMPTVALAAQAIVVDTGSILKTLLFQNAEGEAVRVIASGTNRVDRKRLERLAGIGSLSMAPPQRVLEVTGWPAGGVSPVGCRLDLRTYVDRRVSEQSLVYGGGGTEWTLIGLNPAVIVTLTEATIADLIQ